MYGYRKVERVAVPLAGRKHWEEIAFSELREGDLFRLTDLDDNGKVSITGEDGTKIWIATSQPKVNEQEVYGLEAEPFEGTEEEIFSD